MRVAIARGPAFSFHYEENLELLQGAGAELAEFDPLHDEALPEDTDALILAGGFPEIFGDELSANAALRAAIAAFDGPILAECGGLLYLAETLDERPMCGVLPVEAHMTGRLTLGYREATSLSDHPVWPKGTVTRGHEFHYSQVSAAGNAWEHHRGREGHVAGKRPRVLPAHALGGDARGGRSAGGGVRLIGIGVGPGDPEHLTLEGAAVPEGGRPVFVPAGGRAAEIVCRARGVHAARLRDERRRQPRRALGPRRRSDRRGRAHGTAAFATIGDPNLYSTFTYIAHTVRALVPDVIIETVPGITAMQDLAARSGTVLAEGEERLALVPYTAGDASLREALGSFDTVIVYKGGRHLPHVLDAVREAGREPVYGENLGRTGETLTAPDGRAPYFSTVIAPARREGRGSRL